MKQAISIALLVLSTAVFTAACSDKKDNNTSDQSQTGTVQISATANN